MLEKKYKKTSITQCSTSGYSFTTILTIIFVVLKLLDLITWNWFWVLSPTIFGIGIGILLVILVTGIILIEH